MTSDTFRCHIFPLGANLDTIYLIQEYVTIQQEVQISESLPHFERNCEIIVPLGVQQLVSGAVPLKAHLCTLLTPKKCILVP